MTYVNKSIGFCLLYALSCLIFVECSAERVVGCYFGSWAVYRPGVGKFDVEDIDPFLCTHIFFGFAGLSEQYTIKALDPYNELYDNYGKGAYSRFTALTRRNPYLKAMLAIGGWNEGSSRYSEMASSRATRYTFIRSCVDFLIKFGFHGLDLDWEYPANRGGGPLDKANHAQLLRELRQEFDKHGFLLTAAVSAGKDTIDTAYHVPALAESLDFINLMAYDYHGAWSDVTGHSSPLYARSDETGAAAFLNTEFSVKYWILLGMPRDKIVLGMGLYGRGFLLANWLDHGFGAYAPRPIPAGPFTRSPGFWGYNEICQDFDRKRTWKVVRDRQTVSPYAYRNGLWIGYDDAISISVKGKYIVDEALRGGMVWSIETDDFRGTCSDSHGQSFPLISALKRALHGNQPRPIPTVPTSAAPRSHPTRRPIIKTTSRHQPTPADGRICKRRGPNPDPNNGCSSLFYMCSYNPDGSWRRQTLLCPPTTVFNRRTLVCDYPQNTDDCAKASTRSDSPVADPTVAPRTVDRICKSTGMNPDPDNQCSSCFYLCTISADGSWSSMKLYCGPPTSVFNRKTKACDYPDNIDECQRGSTEADVVKTTVIPSGPSTEARTREETLPPIVTSQIPDIPPTRGPGGRYCPREGTNPDPDRQCSSIFYQCVHDGGNDWRYWQRNCPSPLKFNAKTRTCDYARNIAACLRM